MPHRLTDITRYAIALLLGAAVVAVGCGSDRSNSNSIELNTTAIPALALQRVFPALSFTDPVDMLQAPDDSTRWFVVQRNGAVIVFPNNDAATPAQTSEFISIPVNAAGEGGLLGMAFHPDFPAVPQVFLSYTRSGPDAQHPLTSVISRFTSDVGGLTLIPASEEEILTLDQPFTNHNGGNIAFGPDRLLYIGLGDGGAGNDPLNSGQDVSTILGAMLRIDVDGTPTPGRNYVIPTDNPFAAGGGAPEIYAWVFETHGAGVSIAPPVNFCWVTSARAHGKKSTS